MTCFKGHDLVPRSKTSLPWYCDMCGNESNNKVSFYGCDMCDFDVCNKCAGCLYCKKGHLLLESECDSNEVCSECMKNITMLCFVCNQCEYILCETCVIIPAIKSLHVADRR